MYGSPSSWAMTIAAALPTGIVITYLIRKALYSSANAGGLTMFTECGVGMGFVVTGHLLVHSFITMVLGWIVFHWRWSTLADDFVLPLLICCGFVPFCLDVFFYLRAQQQQNIFDAIRMRSL